MSTLSQVNLPPEPHSIEETGLGLDFLADLVLKTIYTRGLLKGHEIAQAVNLPFANVVDQVLDYLRHEHLTEVRGSAGFGESSYQHVISEDGRTRARELMEQNQYIGPAPVQLDEYTQMVKRQALTGQPLTRATLQDTLKDLVISNDIISELGPAINSGKSIFLFGHPGNGKTSISEAIGQSLPGAIWIPYAVSVHESIIRVFDGLHHCEIPEATAPAETPRRYDRRWVLIRRPLISVGGELRLSSLELVYDPTKKFYEAPYQMKANGGAFLMDDFGRQPVSPRELLNRWIVPLEKRVDYLTLATGHKINVPFDVLIIFATNLNPKDLVDEAFLRRIRYKIQVADPTWDEFREIFRRETAKRTIPYAEDGLRYLVMEYYIKGNRKPRGVHPRDILDELVDIARFEGVRPTLSKELIDRACRAYFIKDESTK